jgi:hypothetical protein
LKIILKVDEYPKAKAARKNFRAALRKKKKNEEDAGDDEW